MNANDKTGASARVSKQALTRLLPLPVAPKQPIQGKHSLTLTITQTGLVLYSNGCPIAWVVQGYHQGQSDNATLHCEFVDVAYYRQTTRGINMETADFQSMDEALDFIASIFGGDV